MSQDPTKAKVIELLCEWCDDPPVSVDEAVKVLSGLVYPTDAERCEAAFQKWWDGSVNFATEKVVARISWHKAWSAAKDSK